MRREMRGERAEVQAGLEQYAAAGAHRFVIMMLEAALRPENYQAELRRLASSVCVIRYARFRERAARRRDERRRTQPAHHRCREGVDSGDEIAGARSLKLRTTRGEIPIHVVHGPKCG